MPSTPNDGSSDRGTGPAPAERPRYRLTRPGDDREWQVYHSIRQGVLLEGRERTVQHPRLGRGTAGRPPPALFWADGRPVGTVRVDQLGDGLAALRLVAIERSCQGSGHGLRLLHEAERFARTLGCRAAVVYSTLEAAGFYQRAGYAEESWDDCCVGGIVQMTKPVG